MKLTDIIEVNGEYYLLDTCFTFDAGWESMAFPCTSDGEVTDWGDVACQRYSCEEQAKQGHEKMKAHLADYLY